MKRTVRCAYLKKASKILRRRAREFMKTTVEFSGMAVKHNEKSYARS